MESTKIHRAAREWSEIAGEPVSVEEIKGTLYAYGSELACLRLYRKWTGAKNVTSGYSTNMKTWYFRVEVAV